jgi:hypothetical protein
LDKLTYYAVKDLNNNIALHNYGTFANVFLAIYPISLIINNTNSCEYFTDKCTRTKLRLAYLQYPSLEIYSLSRSVHNCSSRALLIALVWVITKYDVLSNIIKLKLLNSSLGREFSKVNTRNV